MTQTDVNMSELSDRARDYKPGADIDLPFDEQIIFFDLSADWEFEITNAFARLNAGELNVTILINGVAVEGYDPWNITAGATRMQAPTGTGPAIVQKDQQLRVEIEVTTGMTTPEKFKLEISERATKDIT